MCSSPKSTFTWFGALLINIGFVALISWGASTLWFLGFILSALYTAALFGLTKWVEKLEYDDVRPANTVENGEHDRPATEDDDDSSRPEDENAYRNTTPPKKISLSLNLLYGLAVVSLGVTCFLLPINLIKDCSDESPSWWGPEYEWMTNTTALPENVRWWAQSNDHGLTPKNSFAYIASSKTTLFLATSDTTSIGYRSLLAVVDSSNPPRFYDRYKNPGNFVSVTNYTACFTSVSGNYQGSDQIYCSNGTSFQGVEITTDLLYQTGRVRDFLVDQGLLWFKQNDDKLPDRGGSLVFSMDPSIMKAHLYSYKVERRSDNDGNDDQSCDPRRTQRQLSISTLFVAVLPVTMVSISLWYTKYIPSMASTTYIGLSLIYATIYGAIDPEFRRFDRGLQWYLCVSGLIWLVVLTYYNLSGRTVECQKHPLKWGLVVAAIGFMGGTWSLLPMDKDRLIDWLAMNLCIFFPLLLVGMVNSVTFLHGLGCIGLFVDAVRISAYIGGHVGGDAQVPIFFVVFVLTGLLAGAIGYQLTKWQIHLQNVGVTFVHWLDCSILSSIFLFNMEENFCDHDVQTSTSLLEISLLESSSISPSEDCI